MNSKLVYWLYMITKAGVNNGAEVSRSNLENVISKDIVNIVVVTRML